FRADLLYRINTVEIHLPALRERREDILPLLEHFIALYSDKYRLPPRQLAARARAALQAYAWPGNVRELRHAAERAVIMAASPELEASDLLPATGLAAPATASTTAGGT